MKTIVIIIIIFIFASIFTFHNEYFISKNNFYMMQTNLSQKIIKLKQDNSKLKSTNEVLSSQKNKAKNKYDNHALNYIIKNIDKSSEKLNSDIWLSFNIKFYDFKVKKIKVNSKEKNFKTKKSNILIFPIQTLNLKDHINLHFEGINSKNDKIEKNYTCMFDKINFYMQCNENIKTLF